mmetsp:Transcript_131040/g.226834  ORF Transcript_131040/g.226834 Transcript_131040/m.226834 type:complete len:239 (+) Transcript_131040:1068-1784(+)
MGPPGAPSARNCHSRAHRDCCRGHHKEGDGGGGAAHNHPNHCSPRGPVGQATSDCRDDALGFRLCYVHHDHEEIVGGEDNPRGHDNPIQGRVGWGVVHLVHHAGPHRAGDGGHSGLELSMFRNVQCVAGEQGDAGGEYRQAFTPALFRTAVPATPLYIHSHGTLPAVPKMVPAVKPMMEAFPMLSLHPTITFCISSMKYVRGSAPHSPRSWCRCCLRFRRALRCSAASMPDRGVSSVW